MRMKKSYTLTFGRDEGKEFVIHEMSAAQSENWAFRFLAIVGKSVVLNINPLDGMNGIAAIVEGYKVNAGSEKDIISMFTTFIKNADPVEIKPLLDELMDCIKAIAPNGEERNIVCNDIEEGRNLMELKIAALVFHASIFISGGDKKKEDH